MIALQKMRKTARKQRINQSCVPARFAWSFGFTLYDAVGSDALSAAAVALSSSQSCRKFLSDSPAMARAPNFEFSSVVFLGSSAPPQRQHKSNGFGGFRIELVNSDVLCRGRD
jgi:hypothetical protein